MNSRYDERKVEKIDLIEMMNAILNKWHYILLSALWLGGITLLVNKYIYVPQYSSTAKLYVLSNTTSIISMSDISLGTTLTSDYIMIAKSRAVAEQVIEDLELDMVPGTLLGKVSIENPSGTHILNFTVTDTSPIEAKRIADKYVEVSADYIAEKMGQSKPSIWEYGIASRQQISPNTRENVQKGLLAGAALAIAIVVVLHLMDDTLKTEEEIENYLGMNTLATVLFDEEAEKDEARVKKDRKKSGRKRSDRKRTTEKQNEKTTKSKGRE
jgi:capsular polysaccharide biosynthesis protein